MAFPNGAARAARPHVSTHAIAVAALGLFAAAACTADLSEDTDSAASAISNGETSSAVRGYGGKCLDVSGGSSANGAKVQLWSCNGTNAQRWTLKDGALVTPSGKCLDAAGVSSANGTPVHLWDCHGGENQRWKVDGERVIGIGGKCLDARGVSSADGTPIQLWECHGGDNQKWRFDGTTAKQPQAQPGGNVGGGAGTVFEGFDDGFGLLGHAWSTSDGVKAYVSGGIAKIDGTRSGAGLMQFPGGKTQCLGNGLFEIRAKLKGPNVGDNSGPANVLWPADDVWPGSEVDIGEIDRNGRVYMATHWKGGDGKDAYNLYYAPDGFDQYAFHTYAAFMQTNKITYMIDGAVIGTETAHPAPDAAHGGVNHCIGIMNRSSQTGIEADWVRWTPEASVR